MAEQGSLVVAEDDDVDIDYPSHVKGVHEGNWPGRSKKRSGIELSDRRGIATGRRSTSINPEDREPTILAAPA